MTRISKRLRQQAIERAQERCEYCQTQLRIVVALEVDHIIPESAGGRTTLDNLCLACPNCNRSKLDFQTGVDPQTTRQVALFNPRAQVWSEHFAWGEEGTVVVGLTPTGRATVERLDMNRLSVVQARKLWVRAGWHPPEL